MTTSQRIKLSIIAALSDRKPDESIAVVDAKTRDPIELPLLAVDAISAGSYSQALQHVERIGLQIVLRIHAGDEDETDVDGWTDQIESILTDVSLMKSLTSDRVKIFSWVYNGSIQDWDENILEIAFSVEALCSRFDLQPQDDRVEI